MSVTWDVLEEGAEAPDPAPLRYATLRYATLRSIIMLLKSKRGPRQPNYMEDGSVDGGDGSVGRRRIRLLRRRIRRLEDTGYPTLPGYCPASPDLR